MRIVSSHEFPWRFAPPGFPRLFTDFPRKEGRRSHKNQRFAKSDRNHHDTPGFFTPAVSIYPRKGTETLLAYPEHGLLFVSIYPRKGTETGKTLKAIYWDLVSIYPRKGTETGRTHSKRPTHWRLYLSPQGDGNFWLPLLFQLLQVSIYPRKGTETSAHLAFMRAISCLYLSPQGDGNIDGVMP